MQTHCSFASKLASTVAAGCTVVIKPSELSALQTQVLIEVLHEAKLPKDLLNVVTGRGDVVGAELVRNPNVDKISFTGSVAVGESIMRDSAATMKRVTLELGGKSPTILLDDADLGRAIPAALTLAFMNSLRRRNAVSGAEEPVGGREAGHTGDDVRLYGRQSSRSRDRRRTHGVAKTI
jgi:acyl-CoA reductase-like NAD-dependent aldehyde dehydrogenase